MSKSIRTAISTVAVFGFCFAAFAAAPASAQVRVAKCPISKKYQPCDGKLAFLGPEQFTGRWIKDAKYFNAKANALGIPSKDILDYNANADITTQTTQANAAMNAGAKVIVLAAVDQNEDAPIVNNAEAHGVKVLAYDRMIQSPKLRAYDSFDNVGVGVEQGTWFKANVPKGKIVEILGSSTDHNAALFYAGFCKVICPLTKGSKAKYSVCYSVSTPNWDPSTAGTEMDSAFTKCGQNNIKGVYSMNDGMAADIYTSIKNHLGSKKLPLTGQDAQPDGLGRILLHEQGMTVFKFVKAEANSAAQVGFNWLTHQPLPKTYKKNCGVGCAQATGRHVPAALFTPISITLHTVGLPVQDGFDTWATTNAGIGVCPSVGLSNTSPYCGLPH